MAIVKTGSKPRPREPEPREEKKSKRRKHDLLKEDWGEEKDEKEPRQLAANSEGNQTQIGGSTSKAINNQACNLRLPIPVKTNLQEGAPPTQVCPSGGNLCEGSLGGVTGEGGHSKPSPIHKEKGTPECEIEKDTRKCITHQCEVQILNIPTRKWLRNEKTKCYSWRKVNTTKYICRVRKEASRSPDISTSSSISSDLVTLDGAGIGDFSTGDFLNTVNLASGGKDRCESERLEMI